MKQHFGQIFLGVCIVIAALVLTHPPQRQSHHYEWRWDVFDPKAPVVLDSDTGNIFILYTNGTWIPLKPIPVRH
jgi:hypothetical protein